MMFKNYFKIAWRNMVRHKMYSFINIIGLSIGLASCMLIMLYSKDENSFDKFHKNNAEIYRITTDETTPEGVVSRRGSTGMMQGPTFKRLIPEVENFVRLQSTHLDIQKGAEVITQDALKVDSSFFSVFKSFQFLEGSQTTALKNTNDIVLSEETAMKYFGNTKALGKEVRINFNGEFSSFNVSGVVKNSPENSSIKIDLLIPYHADKNQDQFWINFFLNTFLVLNKNADIEKVNVKMNQLFASEAKDQLKMVKEEWGFKNKIEFALQPLLAIHLSKDYKASNGLTNASESIYAFIFEGIAIFILVIACINFVNLTVARSIKRAKEIGIRKVIGGSRKLLIFQFLGESFLLSSFAFIAAILMVQLVLPFFNTMANKELSLGYLFDLQICLNYFLLFIVTALLAGFYPAIVLSGFRPVDVLYSRLKFSRGAFLQKGLVVLQFVLSGFLIVTTIILYSQFNFLVNKDLGYNDQNVLKIGVGDIDRNKAKIFADELLKNPNIIKVAPHNQGTWFSLSMVNGTQEMAHAMEIIDENYLSTYQLKITQGRNFSSAFPSDSSTAVLINEAFAKEANWKNPIGQLVAFQMNKNKYQVVGVVKDYHFQSLHENIKPQLFMSDPDIGSIGEFCISIGPKNIVGALQHLAKSFHSFFPSQPYSYEFVSDFNKSQYEAESKWKKMITFSAILTIFISCIGLYGLAALSAENKIKEIGIRKVLGASVRNIVALQINNFIQLVALAALISFPISWWVGNKFLEDYPYKIHIGFWMFLLALLLTFTIAIFTVGYHAIKSSMSNPIKSLRVE